MELKPQGESDDWLREEGEHDGQMGQHVQGSEVEGRLAVAKVEVKDKHLIHASLALTGQAHKHLLNE